MSTETKGEFLTPELLKKISDELQKGQELEFKKIFESKPAGGRGVAAAGVGAGQDQKDQGTDELDKKQQKQLKEIHALEKEAIEHRLSFIGKAYHRNKRVVETRMKKRAEEYKKFQEQIQALTNDPSKGISLYPLKVSMDFNNWSGTVQTKKNFDYFFGVTDDNMVSWFHPVTTRDEVCKIVKQAKLDNKRVRCFGARHSFTKVFGDDGTILISMLPLVPALLDINLPFEQFPALTTSVVDGDLNYLNVDEKTGILTVGGGVTNEMIRKYLVNSNSNWQLPTSVVLVEVTAAGVLSTICHGAGKNYKTVSDYATSVEFVDPNGDVYEIPGNLPNGKEILKSAAGALGLFGIITKLSLQLEKKSIAVFAPAKIPLEKAIPPPSSKSPEDILAFYKNCEKTYNGFIWFPGASDVWVYSWDTVDQVPPNKTLTPEYPSKKDIEVQEYRSAIFDQFRWLNALLGKYSWWRTLLGDMALASMPDYSKNPIYTPKENAMYFARGLRNVKLRDAELEIPLVLEGSQVDDHKAWDIARAFWSAAVEFVKKELIINSTLEMRILSGSDVTLAPQSGNKYTLSIEIVAEAPTDLDRQNWDSNWEITVKRFQKLMGQVAKQVGIPPNRIRPHWAKEHFLSVQEMHERIGVKNFTKFKSHLASLAQSRNISFADFFSRFSNQYLDQLFLIGPEAETAPKSS